MMAVPDPATARLDPFFARPTVSVLANAVDPVTRKAFTRDPRHVARKAEDFTAPELPGRTPDARSDVFSLGAVLYTLLAGHHWTLASDVGRSVEADYEIAPQLKTILLTVVDIDPDRRYPSVGELGAALSSYLDVVSTGPSW